MSMDFARLGTMVFFVTPVEVELSVWRSDHVWGQSILVRVWRRGGVCLAVMKRANNSYLASEYMTNLMIWARVRSEPLLNGMGTSSERKMWAPAQLRCSI